MRRLSIGAFLVILGLAQEENVGRVEVLRPEFQRLFDAGVRIERVATGFQFTEGPLWSPKGHLLFSDIYGDKIFRWLPGGEVNVFRDPGQNPNGLTYDRKGRLLICEQKLRRLARVEKDGSHKVLADRWEGKSLNCPNDVVVRKDGTIYFTDPYWKFPPGAEQELDFQGLFRLTRDGKLSLEAKDFGLPNGLGFSPDERTLYVGDTRRRKLYAFDVAPDGSLSGQRLLTDMQSSEKGAVDGLKVDELGNIYSTGPGGVWVISPAGEHLGTIRAAEIPANCAWGDSDFRALYLTAPKAVYRVRAKVRGNITYKLK